VSEPPSGKGFPSAVIDAPVLRGLDARAVREIEAAGRVLTLEPGQEVYRIGGRSDGFFVVASGAIALRAVRRGDVGESELRRVTKGEVFGEEATVGAPYGATAAVVERAVVAEIPVAVLRRAAARSGGAAIAEAIERSMRRRATRERLATLAFTRDLPERDLELALDAIRYVHAPRGQVVYREGDAATDVFLVGDGLVQLQTEDHGRQHVRAYLSRGDFFGDTEIVARARRETTAVASGPSLLLSIPAAIFQTLADRNPGLAARMRRVTADRGAAMERLVGGAASLTTAHVFHDLYRLDVARSMLVIDLDTCVRCGHCAWSCAELHGVARLVRRGDKMVARVDGEDGGAPKSLLLPSSCQHCESPSCLPSCPTGAIGRDARGDVFIRDALCTGCGACAKACPWDNIAMAPRPAGAPRPPGADYPLVATKCELCRDVASGPACVAACPVGSITRIAPAEVIADVREALGRPASGARGAAEARRPALALGAAIAALGLAWTAPPSPAHGLGLAMGALAAVGFALLLAYAIPKRGVAFWARRGGPAARADEPEGGPEARRSRVRPHAEAHVAIGLLTVGLALAHARPALRPTSGSALAVVFLATSALGALTALAYRLVPRRLARLERKAALPEDLGRARADLVDRLYREVSGRGEVVKALVDRRLLPYARRPLGWLALVASGRGLREEEAAVFARVGRALEADPRERAALLASPRLAGLDAIVRLAVELRALPARRWLLAALRAGLPLHIVTFGLAAALLVLHVAVALVRP
jgi:Fe-S-cluster-containing dehydrogenase component/CRP-like cAMP-binding protein